MHSSIVVLHIRRAFRIHLFVIFKNEVWCYSKQMYKLFSIGINVFDDIFRQFLSSQIFCGMLIREVAIVERQKRVKNIFTQITNQHHRLFSDLASIQT